MACTDSDYAYLRALVLEQSANLIDPSRNALFDTRLNQLRGWRERRILRTSSAS